VTEVQLSLRNNAPGGIGNDLALDNISFRTCGDSAFILPEEPANICDDGAPLPLYTTVVGELYDNPAVQWQISPNGFTNWTNIAGANDTVYFHDILASGEYFYRYQLADGPVNLMNEKCRINSNVKQVIVLPTSFFVQDTICAGGSLMVGNSTYTESGLYVDSLINSLGCDSIVNTNLTVLTEPAIVADIEVSSSSCFNTQTGQVAILGVNGGSPPYSFNFDGVEVGETTLFEELPGGREYDFIITDRFGCTAVQTIAVPSPDILTLDVGSDLNLELGEAAVISANTNFTVENYFWSTSSADELICATAPDCPTLSWLPTANQSVVLTAEDANGCTITDSLQINVVANYELFVPNVFSPNDDGINDRFTLYGPQPRISSIQQLQVFDRWGQLVFDGTDLTPGALGQGWDGTAKGQDVSQGVYIYRALVQFLDGFVREVGGDVTVLR
jgi:gliding motility-associated-like protein